MGDEKVSQITQVLLSFFLPQSMPRKIYDLYIYGLGQFIIIYVYIYI